MLRRASNAGEHTIEVLRESGVSDDDIAKYIESGVVEQFKQSI